MVPCSNGALCLCPGLPGSEAGSCAPSHVLLAFFCPSLALGRSLCINFRRCANTRPRLWGKECPWAQTFHWARAALLDGPWCQEGSRQDVRLFPAGRSQAEASQPFMRQGGVNLGVKVLPETWRGCQGPMSECLDTPGCLERGFKWAIGPVAKTLALIAQILGAPDTSPSLCPVGTWVPMGL